MLKTRILTAITLIIGFLTALFLASSMVWNLLTLAVVLIGVWEWSHLIKLNTMQMRLIVTTALAIGLSLILTLNTSFSVYNNSIAFTLLSSVAVFWVIFAPLWLISRKKFTNVLGMSILGLLLLLATWLAFVGLRNISPWLLLGVLSTVSIADSAAYFAGKRFGRHKLAVEISPGKTWEGVAGALIAVTIYGCLLCYYLHYSPWLMLGLWLIVVLSIMGDLFESLLKRQAGLKDSSQLLPGHGGVLDRIDGLIPTLPLVYLAWLITVYVR